jgi:hypothetical protein
VVVALSSKYLDVRGEWTKKVKDVKLQNVAEAQKLEAAQNELRRLRDEYVRLMAPYGGQYATDVAVISNNNPADPEYSAQVTLAQLGIPDSLNNEKPLLHLFMPNGDGTYIYAGPMQMTTALPNSVSFKPSWQPVRASEIAQFRAGNWRVRPLLPADYVNHFRELEKNLAREDVRLADSQKSLSIQDDLVAKAQATLAGRREELLGFANPPANAEELEIEFTKGLAAALAEMQKERDADLAEVDRLRREVKAASRNEAELIRRNARLAASLPGAAPAESSEPAKATVSSR